VELYNEFNKAISHKYFLTYTIMNQYCYGET